MAIQSGTRFDDVLRGGRGRDFVFGQEGDDLLDGGPGADFVLGGPGSDTLVFVAAENTGNGRLGDFYDGGPGSDKLQLEFTAEEWADPAIQQDVVAYLDWLDVGDTAELYTFSTIPLHVKSTEFLELYVDGQLIEDPRNPVDEEVIDKSASTTDEVIEALDDRNYVVLTGSGNDTVTLGAGDDTVSSGAGNDIIYTKDGDDVIHAGPGQDRIILGQGGGNDVVDGGEGTDIVEYPSAVDGVLVDLRRVDRSTQVVTVQEDDGSGGTVAVDYVIGDILGSAIDVDTGLAYDPTLAVGYATGTGIGVDVLIDVEQVMGGPGNDTIFGNVDENLLLGQGGDDALFGEAGDDRIEGGDGADNLEGGDGDDRMVGGAGDDTLNGGLGSDQLILQGDSGEYIITNISGGTYQIEDLVAGRDGVDQFSSFDRIVFQDLTVFSYQLPPAGPITGTSEDDLLEGTPGNDQIYGLEGNDTIFGYDDLDAIWAGPGDDWVDGGDGYDTIFYSNLGSGAITVDLRDLANPFVIDQYGDTDTVFNVEFFVGSQGDDVFYASEEEGQRFNGGLGADVFVGNVGWDSVSYEWVPGAFRGIEVIFDQAIEGSGVTVADQGGFRDTFSGIENIAGSSKSDIILGGLGDQTFADGSYDDGTEGLSDIIDGGAGNDTLDVTGTPSAIVMDMEALLSEQEVLDFIDLHFGGLASLQPETVSALQADLTGFFYYTNGVGNLSIARSVENVVLYRGADDEILGDSANNLFQGDAGMDTLDGRGGNDTLLGGLDNDTLIGGSGSDFLDGGDGDDRLSGGTGDDYLSGGFHADEFVFAAGDGNDVIADFEIGIDTLSIGDLTIESTQELDLNGDGGLDTLLTLSSGDTIGLLQIFELANPDVLFI